MAKLQLSVHSDLREQAQPLVDALQHVADSIEGYYGYIMGCQDKMDANYNAMIWGTNHLAGLVSKERPSYEFGYSDEQDAELEKLLLGIPFPLIRHTHKRLFLCHWDIFSGTHEAFVFIKCSMIAPGR